MKAIFSHHVLATDSKVAELNRNLSTLLGEGVDLKSQRALKPEGDLKAEDWEKLIQSTVSDFDTFVITTLRIGRATVKTANLMKTKGKRVLFYNGRELLPLRFIKEVDGSDWRQGWMCIYGK